MTMQLAMMMLLLFDLTTVKTEPNLERRAELAMKNADEAVTRARAEYDMGKFAEFKASLQEVHDSVDLCWDSLVESGKTPRKSRGYKRSELIAREMLRRLDALRSHISVVDRDTLDPVRMHVAEIHDKVLNAVMSKKK